MSDYQPIFLKRVETPDALPRADLFTVGELVMQVADGKLFMKLIDGQILCVGADIEQFAIEAEVDAALAQKADAQHSHAIANVTDLQDALDSKANSQHSHAIADISTLSDLLNGKANAADISALTQALSSKANTQHTHAIADITNLQSILDSKLSTTPAKLTIQGVQGATDDLLVVKTWDNKVALRVAYDGAIMVGALNGAVGFYGITPSGRSSIVGSRGGNAALTMFLDKLGSNKGLFINNTST